MTNTATTRDDMPRPTPDQLHDEGSATDRAAASEESALDRVMAAFRVLQVQHTRVLRRESAARGLNPTDVQLLFFLSANDGATSKHAGEYLELTTGSMTNVIDRVENRGHIERRPNPGDRRSSLLFLTRSGAQIASDIGTVYRAAFRDAVPEKYLAPVADAFEHVGIQLS